MYVCMYVCMYVRTYVCMNECMFALLSDFKPFYMHLLCYFTLFAAVDVVCCCFLLFVAAAAVVAVAINPNPNPNPNPDSDPNSNSHPQVSLRPDIESNNGESFQQSETDSLKTPMNQRNYKRSVEG